MMTDTTELAVGVLLLLTTFGVFFWMLGSFAWRELSGQTRNRVTCFIRGHQWFPLEPIGRGQWCYRCAKRTDGWSVPPLPPPTLTVPRVVSIAEVKRQAKTDTAKYRARHGKDSGQPVKPYGAA